MNLEQLEHCCWHWGVPQTKEQSFNFFLMWGFLFLGHETIAWHQALLWGIKDKKWGETATKMAVKWAVSGEWCPYSLSQTTAWLTIVHWFLFFAFFPDGEPDPRPWNCGWIDSFPITLSSACARNIIWAGKCDSCCHSTMNFSENVVVAKTSCQM